MESVTPALIMVEEVVVAVIVALYWLKKKKKSINDVYSLRLPKFQISRRQSPGHVVLEISDNPCTDRKFWAKCRSHNSDKGTEAG